MATEGYGLTHTTPAVLGLFNDHNGRLWREKEYQPSMERERIPAIDGGRRMPANDDSTEEVFGLPGDLNGNLLGSMLECQTARF